VTRILRGLSSKFLPCGCLAGIYETYDGHVVGILDARSGVCSDPSHETGKPVPDGGADSPVNRTTSAGGPD
jgi:hypothetical protein